MQHPLRSYAAALAVFVGCAAVLLSTWPRESFLLDDALIYQNFVRSLLEGRGFEYSPGEVVEGFSSPLWVLMLCTGSLFGATGLMGAKVIGLFCYLLSVGVVATSRALRADPTVLLLAVLLFALQPALAWYAVSGMDTPLLVLLVTCLVVAAVDDRPVGVAVAGGLLWISRPEGAMYTLGALLWLALQRRSGEWTSKRSAALLAGSLLPGFAWQVFRLGAFGTLVANSALAKLVGSDLEEPAPLVSVPWEYIRLAITDLPGVGLALGLAAVLAVALRRHCAEQPFATPVLFASLAVAQFGFVMNVGWDWMPFSRFWLALVPVAVVGLASLLVGARNARIRQLGVSAMVLAVLMTAWPQYTDFTEDRRWGGEAASFRSERAPFRDPLQVDRGAIFQAFALLRFTKPGDTVMLKDVGQVGYMVGDLRFMDQYGLVSRFEAEYLAGRRTKADLTEHFKQLNPSMVFVRVEWETETPAEMRIDVALHHEVQSGYRSVMRAPWNGPTQLIAYLRNDLPSKPGPIDRERYANWDRNAPDLQLPAIEKLTRRGRPQR